MVLSPTMPEPEVEARGDAVSGLRRLVAWAVAARQRELPEHVRRRASLVLLDDLAAIVAASSEPQIADAQAILLRAGGVREVRVLAAGERLATKEQAAAANGLAITWAELDEGFRLLPCHAGAYILPALIAEAEAAAASLDDVLVSLAIAYEITARIAKSYPFHRLSIHPHAAFNAIGAATGLALLRKADAKVLFDTITAASTLVNAGPFNHAIEGGLVRNVWTSIGATAGFRAADFAPLGIAGLDAALHDVFVDGFGCRPQPEHLSMNLPEGEGAFAIEDGYHKVHACCQYTHSAVEASLQLADKVSDPDAIAWIEVETHARGMALDVRRPATVLAAKFSMPHAVAAVAAKHSAGPKSFDLHSLTDPAIDRLRQTVVLKPHDNIRPMPNDRPARIHWVLRDGQRVSASVDSARGGADQPFSETELLEKFASLTADVFPAAGDVSRQILTGKLSGQSWRKVIAAYTK
ncbi:MAG: MmgE/PrpD family protein [Hyphomicrobiales bacterium]|nr:MmgE/PrpD family protein [Hyphomicrobiales bacterium]